MANKIEKQTPEELADTALRVIQRMGTIGVTAREALVHRIRKEADLNGRYDTKIEDGLVVLGEFVGEHRL